MQKEIRLEKVLMELLVSMAGKLITKTTSKRRNRSSQKHSSLHWEENREKVIIISFNF